MIAAYWQRTQKEFPALLFRCFPAWDVGVLPATLNFQFVLPASSASKPTYLRIVIGLFMGFWKTRGK